VGTVFVPCTVTNIFSVEYCRDIEIWVRDRSNSLNMAPFDRSHTSLAFHYHCN